MAVAYSLAPRPLTFVALSVTKSPPEPSATYTDEVGSFQTAALHVISQNCALHPLFCARICAKVLFAISPRSAVLS
jgi:hypothetical protein